MTNINTYAQFLLKYLHVCIFRIRGTATGITSACSYIMIFAVTKTYLNVEVGLSIGGGFLLYGCITTVGLLTLYLVLPETEGRTLEEIENYFSDKTRSVIDRNIRPLGVASGTTTAVTSTSDNVLVKSTKDAAKSLDNPAFVDGV